MKSKHAFATRDFNLLRPAPVRGTFFHWNKYSGIAMISDLGPGFDFDRVWNDACDEGLTVISDETGTEVVFAMNHIMENGDEVQAWKLLGATRGYEHLSLTIFND